MAPFEELLARANGCGSGWYWDGRTCRQNSWHHWGRWILAGIAVCVALVVLLGCLCLSRKKRKAGAQPMYGTGWMGGGNKHNNHNNNGHEMNNYQAGYGQGGYDQQPPVGGYGGYASPPPYGQPMNNQATGTTFNPNDGYYTGQQYGVQQPPHTYQPDAPYPPGHGK